MKKILFFLLVVISSAAVANIVSAANTNSNSLRFNGVNQYLSGANPRDITIHLTIEGWVNVNQLPSSTGSLYFLVNKDDVGSQRSYTFFIGADDKVYLYYFNNTGYTYYVSNNPVITISDINNWTHIAVTVDAQAAIVVGYKNGVSIAGSTPSMAATSINNSTAPLLIGARSNLGALEHLFSGLMDDIRIWNTTRTAAEIADNYQTELVGNEAGLIGYWNFEGDTVDATANGNDLTNNGASFSIDVPFTGETPSTNSCSISIYQKFSEIADINGDGNDDMLQLGLDADGISVVCIIDITQDSDLIKEILFSEAAINSVKSVSDKNADGLQDVAGMTSAGRIIIKDSVDGATLSDSNPFE